MLCQISGHKNSLHALGHVYTQKGYEKVSSDCNFVGEDARGKKGCFIAADGNLQIVSNNLQISFCSNRTSLFSLSYGKLPYYGKRWGKIQIWTKYIKRIYSVNPSAQWSVETAASSVTNSTRINSLLSSRSGSIDGHSYSLTSAHIRLVLVGRFSINSSKAAVSLCINRILGLVCSTHGDSIALWKSPRIRYGVFTTQRGDWILLRMFYRSVADLNPMATFLSYFTKTSFTMIRWIRYSWVIRISTRYAVERRNMRREIYGSNTGLKHTWRAASVWLGAELRKAAGHALVVS